MKRLGIYVLAMVMALGMACGADDPTIEETSTMYIFKVDFADHNFEGGVTVALQQVPPPLVSEIPLEIDRDEATPGIDGAIGIIYTPSAETIFRGELTNSGNAALQIPTLIDPASFLVANQSVDLPAGTNIQSIDGDHTQVDFTPIWAAISDLAITDFALEENTKIGLFLYQPNTNSSFSDNWDWFIFLYNQ